MHSYSCEFISQAVLKSSSCTGEEGDLFEGDIRLQPGEDPYNILHVYRHRAKRMVMQDEGQEGDPNLLNETTTSENSRLWPGNIIPFKYKPELGMSFGDTHKCASTTFDCMAICHALDLQLEILDDKKNFLYLDPLLRISFADARKEWERATNNCIKFVPKTENHTDFLYFTDDHG